MALRKASSYSKFYARPYTRKSKVKQKSYIKTVPNSLVVKFRMGDLKGFKEGKYKIILNAVAKDAVQMRDNSIESMRQYLNRFLTEKFGKDFYFEVKPYPHHILRENKMLTAPGADRMQTGMSLSYGKSMGRAAFIKPGKTIFKIGVLNDKQEIEARKLIKSVRPRMPSRVSVVVQRI